MHLRLLQPGSPLLEPLLRWQHGTELGIQDERAYCSSGDWKTPGHTILRNRENSWMDERHGIWAGGFQHSTAVQPPGHGKVGDHVESCTTELPLRTPQNLHLRPRLQLLISFRINGWHKEDEKTPDGFEKKRTPFDTTSERLEEVQ